LAAYIAAALQDVYPQDWQAGGPGFFAYAAIAHQTEQDSAGRTAELRNRLMRSWQPYWDMSRQVLIEKTPGNLLKARFLQSLFGDEAYFVFVTRHRLAVSLATQKWSRTSVFALIDHWLTAHEIVREDLRYLRRVICVSYEQLVEDPASTIAEILAFLEMTPMDLKPVNTQDYNSGYFAAWTARHAIGDSGPQRGDVGAVSMPSWRLPMVWRLRGAAREFIVSRSGIDLIFTRREARAILVRYETHIQAFGYSLIDLHRRPGTITVNRMESPDTSDEDPTVSCVGAGD
jgi:hypothetical protein